MKRALIKPAQEGAIIRDPDAGYQPLPEDGQEVELTTFWQRRLNDGDVVLVKGSKAKSPAAKTQAEKE